MSGFAVSAARLGVPDTGLISFAEMLDSVRNCCAAAAQNSADRRRRYRLRQCAERAAHGRRICPCRRRRGDDRGPGQPEKMRPYPRQAGDLARRSAHEDPRGGGRQSGCRYSHHGAHRRARRPRFRRRTGSLPRFRGRRRRYHLPRGARDRRRDAPVLPGHAQAVHGEYGARRQDADLAARATAGDRLQARALSGDAVVGRGRRHAVDARRAQVRRRRAAPPSISFAELQSVVGFPDYWQREERYKVQRKDVHAARRVLIRSRRRAAGSRSSTTSTDNPAPRPCRRRCAATRRAHCCGRPGRVR